MGNELETIGILLLLVFIGINNKLNNYIYDKYNPPKKSKKK